METRDSGTPPSGDATLVKDHQIRKIHAARRGIPRLQPWGGSQPVRFDPKHIHNYEAAYRFLFDPLYKEIIEQWAEKHRIESSRYLVFKLD